MTDRIERTMKELKMYFDKMICEEFAEEEQNEKNFAVADAMDKVMMNEIKGFLDPLHVAELGGGAHPDRYHKLFERLLKTNGKIDWVDISPVMLELARKYLKKYPERESVINFTEKEIIGYLEDLPDNELDLAIMKYTFDHIKEIDVLIKLLSQKVKGVFVANLTTMEPVLKSVSTNARYLYKGEEFPDNETRTLEDGEAFGIRHLKVSGKPELGTIEGGEIVKYYYKPETIIEIGEKYGFEVFIGSWKELVDSKENEVKQNILVLRKT